MLIFFMTFCPRSIFTCSATVCGVLVLFDKRVPKQTGTKMPSFHKSKKLAILKTIRFETLWVLPLLVSAQMHPILFAHLKHSNFRMYSQDSMGWISPRLSGPERGHYERGLFIFSPEESSLKSVEKWSDSPLFARVWGFSKISRISKFSRKC